MPSPHQQADMMSIMAGLASKKQICERGRTSPKADYSALPNFDSAPEWPIKQGQDQAAKAEYLLAAMQAARRILQNFDLQNGRVPTSIGHS